MKTPLDRVPDCSEISRMKRRLAQTFTLMVLISVLASCGNVAVVPEAPGLGERTVTLSLSLEKISMDDPDLQIDGLPLAAAPITITRAIGGE